MAVEETVREYVDSHFSQGGEVGRLFLLAFSFFLFSAKLAIIIFLIPADRLTGNPTVALS